MHRFSAHEVGQVSYPWGDVRHEEPRPFDRAIRLEQYQSAMPRKHGKAWKWREDTFSREFVGVRGILSPEEARFWFAVGTHPQRLNDTKTESLSDQATFTHRTPDSVELAFATWIERFVQECGDLKVLSQAWLARVLCDLLPPGEPLACILRHVPERAVPAFLEHLLPPLPAELAAYRKAGAGYLASLDYTGYQPTKVIKERRKSIAQRLAPMLRDVEATEKLLNLYEREPPASRSNAVMHLINAVEDDDEFLTRLKARVKEWGRREVVLLIGRLGEDGLEVVRDAVVRRNRDTSEGLATALELVDHPVAAEILVHLAQNPTSGVTARDILLRANPAHVAGLLKVAAGRSSRVDLAESLLQEIRRRSPEALQAAAAERPDVDADLLDAAAPEPVAVDLPDLPESEWPGWLVSAALGRKPKGLPRFLTRDFTPVFLVEGGEHILPKQAVYALLQAARDLDAEPDPETGEPRDGRPMLNRFRDVLDNEAAAYAFKVIFDRWNQEGASVSHDWCLRVLGIFGDDAAALDLAKWIDEWPKHDLHDIAEVAVDALADMGSDTSLMALNGIAQRGTFSGLRRWAKHRLNKIAASRGLGPEQLRDLVVDDCGLDADGTMRFDYGTRELQLEFDPDLKPRFRDPDGKVYRSLPRARRSDDPARVNAAKARYKLVKKRLSEVLKTQRRRLEEAMISGRRIRFGHWRVTHVEHPLMTHLAQRFVWGAWEGEQLLYSFRVDEAHDVVDRDDEPIPIVDLAATRIGLIHPLELSEAELSEWASVLGDYEIIPPFPQIDRGTFARRDTEKLLQQLRVAEVSPGAVRGQLKRFGWSMGYAADDGRNHFYSRKMDRADLWAWLILDPGLRGANWKLDEPQQLEHVGFTASRRAPESQGEMLAPAMVDPVAWSEVMRMMSSIFGDSNRS